MMLDRAWIDAPREIFEQQLKLNLRELSATTYPIHWVHFLDAISFLSVLPYGIEYIIDIGCGVGAYYQLTHSYFPNLKYIGYDGSKEAINVALQQWNYPHFYCFEYDQLCSTNLKLGDVIVANALCDVLPNGDECMEYLLKLQNQFLILQRVKLTDDNSYYNTYSVYGGLETCEFYHNKKNLYKMFSDFGYNVAIEESFCYGIKDLLLVKRP